jgi:hypothetical protein
MTLLQLRTYVQDIVKRPDKNSLIDLYLNEAQRQYATSGDFDATVVESSISIDPTLYGTTVSIAGLSRFLRFKYIKPANRNVTLTEINPDKVFTACKGVRADVYFVAGTSLTYALAEVDSSLAVGYQTLPAALSGDSATNWFTETFDFAMIHFSASRVFSTVGDEASARMHMALGVEAFNSVRNALWQEGR